MLEPNVTPELHEARPGVKLAMGSLEDTGIRVSPVWAMGDWQIQFLRLPAGERFNLDTPAGNFYLKVIAGSINGRDWGAYPPRGTVQSARWTGSSVQAGSDGALLFLLSEAAGGAAAIEQMESLTLSGPLAEAFGWQSFEEKFAGLTDYFDGKPAYMVPGFHLLDSAGAAYAYVHFWTTGKGIDVSTHNHGHNPTETSPAFAEVHLTLQNGTGGGGMYLCDARDAPERRRVLMQKGEEHGPFFEVNPATRRPRLLENGAVSYPWHGWESGTDDAPRESFDLVAAFEIYPDYAVI